MSDLLNQQHFFQLLCLWGRAIYARGYEATFGDAYRDPRATFPYAKPGGFHARRLAVDVNLFKAGELLTTVEQWKECGELWETLGGTWGGRFVTGSSGDANHLSLGEGARTAQPMR